MRDAVAPLVIEDASQDARFREHPGLEQLGIRRYIAVPIVRRDGQTFGTLCALDPDPGCLPESLLRQFQLFSELIAQQLQEQQVHAERERFVEVLAHDLRNPLNSISLASMLLDVPGASHAEVPNRIRKNVHRMNELINDLTDLTRGRIGEGISTDCTPVQIRELMEDLVAELSNGEGNDRILVDLPDDLGTAEWDRTRIGQLFSNLLANALKHSPSGSPVQLQARTLDDTIEFKVSNGGDPIPAELLSVIFEPFSRGNSNSESSSLGLGLYIAERIASSHRGDLSVSSDSEAGTRFTVRLPRCVPVIR